MPELEHKGNCVPAALIIDEPDHSIEPVVGGCQNFNDTEPRSFQNAARIDSTNVYANLGLDHVG